MVCRDSKLLLASVFLRRTSFALTNQVLALFLVAVGILKERVGLFMTLTLLGDTAISYYLTWNSDRIGRRLVMAVGCVLMIISGIVFVFSLNFWVLLAAAVVGVISSSGDETGPFKSVEEGCLSHLTPASQRAKVFATYGFLGTIGSAVGSPVCGIFIDTLNLQWRWSLTKCYRAVFVIYAGIGALKLVLAACLSEDCELDHGLQNDSEPEPEDVNGGLVRQENTPLLETGAEMSLAPSRFGLSARTSSFLPPLLLVFMLDSFGYGFMPPAWVVFYFKVTFGVSALALGLLFFFTNLVDSFSLIASMYTFRLFGPVKAIIAVQLPSAVMFAAVAICPTYLLAAAAYLLFCSTTTMDVVPRQILLTSLFPKEDLIRVMGIVNIGKTFARCIGPIFTGKLAAAGYLFVGFYINAGCLVLADSLLALKFVHLDKEVRDMHK